MVQRSSTSQTYRIIIRFNVNNYLIIKNTLRGLFAFILMQLILYNISIFQNERIFYFLSTRCYFYKHFMQIYKLINKIGFLFAVKFINQII